MGKRIVSGIMLLSLLIGMLTLAFNIQLAKSEPETWTVDDDGSADFQTIQEAINAANPGDMIYVYNGTYYEHVTVDKSLTLTGEDKHTTIIDGTLNGTAIEIIVDNVRISEFTIRNGNRGILICSNGNTVSHNNITLSNWEGLVIQDSVDNIITNNLISLNLNDGVYMLNTSNTALQSNTITSNNWTGVHIDSSHGDTVYNNTLSNNTFFGVRLDYSSNISVVGNTISWNEQAGIYFGDLADSTFYHNNLLNNTEQIDSDDSPHVWDNGYPSGGNFWSDFNGVDFYSGPSQSETGSDGVGDTPYDLIDNTNQDKYPFMGQIHLFDAGTWNDTSYSVDIVSNSTVSKFKLSKVENRISFNVSGETGLGFCRVTIPNVIIQDLLQNKYTVLVDGEEPLTINDWTDGTYTYIYFTYLHSEHEVVIQDARSPTISIISPENKTYSANDVPLTFTVNETTSWIGYSLDEQINETISGNTTLSGLSNRTHTITVYANDTAGNMGSSDMVNFTVDTVFPNIEILSPENKTYTTSSVSLNFTVDEATSWIGYSLNGEANVTITGNTTISELSNRLHSLTVYASDMAGNTGASEMIYFTIEAQEVPFPPAWIVAVAVVIAVVGAAILLYFQKLRKQSRKSNDLPKY